MGYQFAIVFFALAFAPFAGGQPANLHPALRRKLRRRGNQMPLERLAISAYQPQLLTKVSTSIFSTP